MKALVGFAALAVIMAGSALLTKPPGATPRMATVEVVESQFDSAAVYKFRPGRLALIWSDPELAPEVRRTLVPAADIATCCDLVRRRPNEWFTR